MTMRRTKHELEQQFDPSSKQGTVQQTRTTLTTKKRHCKQTSSAVVHLTALTSLQLVFSYVSTCLRFAAKLNMLLCLSLSIRVINSLVVNVPTYSLFTTCEFLADVEDFHCKKRVFGGVLFTPTVGCSRPTSNVNDPIAPK